MLKNSYNQFEKKNWFSLSFSFYHFADSQIIIIIIIELFFLISILFRSLQSLALPHSLHINLLELFSFLQTHLFVSIACWLSRRFAICIIFFFGAHNSYITSWKYADFHNIVAVWRAVVRVGSSRKINVISILQLFLVKLFGL